MNKANTQAIEPSKRQKAISVAINDSANRQQVVVHFERPVTDGELFSLYELLTGLKPVGFGQFAALVQQSPAQQSQRYQCPETESLCGSCVDQCEAEKPLRDYDEILANHRRLVRELDVLINGEEGAAQQASICDIVAQVKREGLKVPQQAGKPVGKDAEEYGARTRLKREQVQPIIERLGGIGDLGWTFSDMGLMALVSEIEDLVRGKP